MGICYSDRNKLTRRLFSGESYSNFDKTIFLQKFYMENILSTEDIFPFFSKIIYDQILQEKKSKIKSFHFFKWFEMALSPYHKILSSLKKDAIIKSLNLEKKKIQKKQIEKEENSSYFEIPNFAQDISISEQGLRNYFFSKQIHFQSRILKSPSASFRWTSWIIMSGVPISRPALYYINLLSYDLPEKVEEQIQKDVWRTIKRNEINNHNNYNEKINSLYRILKAIAIIDTDLGYTQGMNFVVNFLLNISNGNEIDVFYLLMSIFSQTFSNKFGMRGFYIDNFPLLYTFSNIFDKKLNLYFPKIYRHFKQINFSSLSWISFWMQQIYVFVFPDEILLRIWDYFFVYGTNFLISFGLGLVEVLQYKILQIDDISEMKNFFKLLNPYNNDIRMKIKFSSIEYDIEKILKNSIEKYFVKNEEIEKELKKVNPEYNNKYFYNYKSIESNPELKNEFALYTSNNSKICSKKNISNTNDSTMVNSKKFKISENSENDNRSIGQENEKKRIYINSEENKYEKFNIKLILEEDSFECDFIDEEEDSKDLNSHIQNLIIKQNNLKILNIK